MRSSLYGADRGDFETARRLTGQAFLPAREIVDGSGFFD